MFEIILIASVFLNLLLFFYVRWLLKTISVINEDISSVSQIISQFQGHLKSVYELEMFYGDNTLKALLDHTNNLSEELSNLDLILNVEEEKEEILIDDKETA
tara:strand:- start:58311 stop:58616 length:306 start_codon:yes stop_codon:yes gene_type:complete